MKRQKQYLLLALKIVCILVAAVSAVLLIILLSSKSETVSTISSLKNEILEISETEPIFESSEEEIKEIILEISGEISEEQSKEESVKLFNEKFRQLYNRNNDFVGWITIDGTSIDLPVMQRDGEFYLNHNFDRYEERHGVPFLDQACNVFSSENLLVYGHNMRDGTMFADLKKFLSPSFCEEGHLITFDTIWKDGLWRVISVMDLSEADWKRFPYHTVTSFSDKTISASQYLEECSKYAVWQSRDGFDEIGRLLTLSTCESSYQNGRLVVIAELVTTVG